MQAPFFSVVIPVYNKEPHIARAINSVLCQSFQDYEIVIVCDPSTDRSTDVVRGFSDERIRIYYRNEPGAGGYAARNLGIKNALSAWVAFLDADDEWECNHLEKYFEAISKKPLAAILSSAWQEVIGESNIITDKYAQVNLLKGSQIVSLGRYVTEEVRGRRPIWTSVACVRKELLDKVGGFPDRKIQLGGDVDLWIRCIALAGELIWSDHVGAKYYRDSVNMVTKSTFVDPKLHYDTTNKLLSENKYDICTIETLKKRSNMLVLFAWNQNVRLGCRDNFNLKFRLYTDVDIFKVIMYRVISKVPYFQLRHMHRLMSIVANTFRGLRRKLNRAKY